MEKLKALKEKHKVPSTEKLKELMRTEFPRMQDNLKYEEQHLIELNARLRERTSEVSTLEESLSAEERVLHAKREECVVASDNLKELEADRNQLLLEVHQLESQRNTLRSKKPSKKDQETLEHGKRKLNCYKQFTGIRWDFGAPKGTVKGYVTNGKDHVHTFSYRNNERDGRNMEDKLWKEIARGTGRSDLLEPNCCKENTVPNT